MIRDHTDVVGSLLRPPWLLEARRQLAAGAICAEELARVEDRAVDEAVRLQERAGLGILTDGEMRRLSFQSQLPAAVEGFGRFGLEAFTWGDWLGEGDGGNLQVSRPAGMGVVGKLVRRHSLSAHELVYLRSRTQATAKITLPSPSLWANFWTREQAGEAYPTLDLFLDDVVGILRAEIAELVGLGAAYIQLDAPHYPLLLDPRTRAFYEARGWNLERWLRRGVELDNLVMEPFPEVTFGLHLCRGNQQSRWLVEGGYEGIAPHIFPHTRAQRLLLEYDDQRSGSFEPLRSVPADKMVILGLITTKSGKIEAPDQVAQRVRAAADHFPLEQLGLSPQCGFASSIIGNDLSAEEQFEKLCLVTATAGEIWTAG
jgi:5-methyltetrahydropteroyltriglutamate--homocysteine methyltransferase